MLGASPLAQAPLAASADSGHTAQGSATLPALFGAGAATVVAVAIGHATLPALEAHGLSVPPVAAAGAAVLPALGAMGDAIVPRSAQGTAVLPMFFAASHAKVRTQRPNSVWTPKARPASSFDPCQGERQGSIDDLGGVGGPHRGAPVETTPDIREFRDDFNTSGHSVVGASIDRRPDAVSMNYLTAATQGPLSIGDVGDGLQTRLWKLRDDRGTIRVCRCNESNTIWEAESVLFTYDFNVAPILELDFAFEQAGRPVVVAERASGLWLYWFDPLLSGFTFAHLGEGRTPRCVLDDSDPLSTSSDVLMFYIRGGSDTPGDRGAVCYRMQRERYAIEHETPIVGDGALTIDPGEDGSVPFHGVGTWGGVVVTAPTEFTNAPLQPPAATVGDFQISDIGLGGYRLVLHFAEPIRQVTLTQHHPLDGDPSWLSMAAVVDDTQFVGIGGAAYFAAASAAWPRDGGQDSTATLTYEPGFSYLVIDTPLRGAFGQSHPAFGPTFGAGSFFTVRDMSDPGTALPLPPIEQMFIEDALKSKDGRVVVLFSVRDVEHGTYTLQSLASSLYPMKLPAEGTLPGNAIISEGELRRVLLIIDQPDGTPLQLPDVFAMSESGLLVGLELVSGILRVNTIFVSPPTAPNPLDDAATDFDAATMPNVTLISGTLFQPVQLYTAFDIDGARYSNASLVSGVIVVIVIVVDATPYADGAQYSNATLQSGTLV